MNSSSGAQGVGETGILDEVDSSKRLKQVPKSQRTSAKNLVKKIKNCKSYGKHSPENIKSNGTPSITPRIFSARGSAQTSKQEITKSVKKNNLTNYSLYSSSAQLSLSEVHKSLQESLKRQQLTFESMIKQQQKRLKKQLKQTEESSQVIWQKTSDENKQSETDSVDKKVSPSKSQLIQVLNQKRALNQSDYEQISEYFKSSRPNLNKTAAVTREQS